MIGQCDWKFIVNINPTIYFICQQNIIAYNSSIHAFQKESCFGKHVIIFMCSTIYFQTSSRCSINAETFASIFLDNYKNMNSRYYMYSDVYRLS